MTETEQKRHTQQVRNVEKALVQLRLALLDQHPDDAEDLSVAIARCENWIAENADRWTKEV